VQRNYYYASGGDGFGNGEWRRTSLTTAQDAGPAFTCQLGEGQLVMEAMEGARIPGKIYSKLSSRVVAMIKLLPPFKLWVKFHDF